MPPRCEKCGFMHYRTDSCRKLRAETRGQEPRINVETKGDDPTAHTSKPKRSGNRHRPGYFTEYMREYRKGIRRRKAK